VSQFLQVHSTPRHGIRHSNGTCSRFWLQGVSSRGSMIACSDLSKAHSGSHKWALLLQHTCSQHHRYNTVSRMQLGPWLCQSLLPHSIGADACSIPAAYTVVELGCTQEAQDNVAASSACHASYAGHTGSAQQDTTQHETWCCCGSTLHVGSTHDAHTTVFSQALRVLLHVWLLVPVPGIQQCTYMVVSIQQGCRKKAILCGT
jgi:hypothetical protein